jgi:putative flippase GtrA
MPLSRNRLLELFRYYQAGIANTVFGLSIYALLVWLGLNMYAAQLAAHVLGMGFNYLSYSRHVFRDAGAGKVRFVAAYGGNYLVGLGTLAAVARFVPSPYLAGILTAGIVSIINYFALKRFVFLEKLS